LQTLLSPRLLEKNKTRHRLNLLLIISLLAISPPATGAPPPSVIVAEARLVDFVDRVEALGTLRANESVRLTVAVTEIVSAIHFEDGDRVEQGKVLVEMTSAEEYALLEEAGARVGEARRQYHRVKSLESQGTEAKSLLDQRRREWETARARLAAIESRLQDRLIRAPFGGVVGLRDISPGALVEPGGLITTLDDDSVMKLDFSVPSTYLASLQPGLEVVARTRAYGDREFNGQVSSVDSRVDPVTRAVLVRAIIPNTDRILKPGMLMRVELLKNPRLALVIPEEALVPQGKKQFVLLVNEVDDSKVTRNEVRIGARRPGEVEVLEGLNPGDRVITHGTDKVRVGQHVVVSAVDNGSQSLRELTDSEADRGVQQ
jgi:membrane fusion protein (multidrug efflux system)